MVEIMEFKILKCYNYNEIKRDHGDKLSLVNSYYQNQICAESLV